MPGGPPDKGQWWLMDVADRDAARCRADRRAGFWGAVRLIVCVLAIGALCVWGAYQYALIGQGR